MGENNQNPGMTRRLARFAVNTPEGSIKAEILEHAKVAFLDFLAVTYGGKDDPLVEKLMAHTRRMGGAPQASLIGQNEKMNVEQAAMINGAAGHALDYDDTLVSFLGHPSVTLFPALLALGEWENASGRAFLESYLIGLQVGGTIGACAGLDHYLGGWHGTATLGHMAAAAGCARMLGLDEERFLCALGLAATQSSGLKRNFGTMTKPFHAGMAAESGLRSALLAADGFTAADDVLEGPQGWFEALKGTVNEDILGFLGLGWDVVNLSQKYHASCHATHSALEAARELVREKNLAVEQIGKITVMASMVAMQAATNMEPDTGLAGKFSIPYCVANALVSENTGMAAFTDEMVARPQVRELMARVEVIHDEGKTALEATVEITTTDGKTFSAFSDILQNIPPLEIKKDRVPAKFMDLASPVIGEDRARELAERVLDLEKVEDMARLAESL